MDQGQTSPTGPHHDLVAGGTLGSPHADMRLSLESFLPYRLSVLSNTLSRQIADAYETDFGLTIGQWRCMAVLGDQPGLNAREVCARTAMDKVAVSRAVAQLEADGRLDRRADTRDRRAARLFLSPAGLAVYRRIVPLALAHERRILADLSPSDVANLNRLLDRLADAVSPDVPLWSTGRTAFDSRRVR